MIKKELNHEHDDDLIKRLDKIADGLMNGNDEFGLIMLDNDPFQQLLIEMKNDGSNMKSELINYRNGSVTQSLFKMSEFFQV